MYNIDFKNTIFAFDLDGTLLKSDKTVSDFTVKTLEQIQHSGAEIFFVTGRRKRVADMVLKPFNFPARLITNNGVSFFNHPNGEKIYSQYFSRQKVISIIKLLKKINRVPVLVIELDNLIQDMIMQKSILKLNVYKDYYEKNKEFIILTDNLIDSNFLHNVTGIFLIEENTEIKNTISFLSSNSNGELHFCSLDNLNFLSTHTILEILEPEMTKWKSICRLKKMIGKDKAKVIAFGDDHNDIDMLQFADKSYAMENAISKAKFVADNTAPKNEDDGVAKILLHYLKNNT